MKPYFFLLFFSLFSFAFCEENFEEVTDSCQLKILNPSFTSRKTAKIRLSNELQVYLISDEKADQSAAALTVLAGSWQDPKEYPGMAHFLEHMLFQGTKAYPNPSEYMGFILDRGGVPNAFTTPDRTVYLFSIGHENFIEALDRFSHFFIDPLFEQKELSNELHAVDQEFAKNIENDGWRKLQIEKQTGNQQHPHAGFSTGNSQTLSKIPPEDMKKWYLEHYSANLMHLVVYSPLPLDTLKKLVVEKFQKVPNVHATALKISEPLLSSAQKGRMLYIVPVKKIERLSLCWELPTSFIQDPSKSANFLAYLLQYESPTSLPYLLKKDHLIENFSAGTEKIGNHHILLSIEIDVTEKGLKQVDTIVQKCFETLTSFKTWNIPSYLFSEMKTMSLLNYQYPSRYDAYSYVKDLAFFMPDEPFETYPEKTLIPSEFSLEKVKQLLDFLSIDNCLISLQAPTNKTHLKATQKEKWMGGEYSLFDLSQKNYLTYKDAKSSPDIQPPLPNPFIPSHLELKTEIDPKATFEHPLKIIDHEKGSLFFAADTDYKTPEISYFFRIKSPSMDGSAKACVLLDLYLLALQEDLSSLSCLSSLANLNHEISSNSLEISLSLYGFSEKAPILFQEICKKISYFSLSKEQFETHMETLKKSYQNTSKELPLIQAKFLLSYLLFPHLSYPLEKEKILKELSYEDFLQFQKDLFKKIYVEGFLSGNLSIQEGESLWVDIQDIFKRDAFPPLLHPQKKVFSFLPYQHPITIEQKTHAKGNAVILALGNGSFSFEKEACQKILSQAMTEPFFTELRSKQKTAYIASNSDLEVERQLFQVFCIQSNTHDPSDLLHRFEAFFEKFVEKIPKYLSKERFESIKTALLIKLKTPPKNLLEMTKKLYTLAFDYEEDFAWRQKQISALESLNYETFCLFAKEALSYKNSRRLVTFLEGSVGDNKSLIYQNLSLENFLENAHYEVKKSPDIK